jgi:hypothetical protein
MNEPPEVGGRKARLNVHLWVFAAAKLTVR